MRCERWLNSSGEEESSQSCGNRSGRTGSSVAERGLTESTGLHHTPESLLDLSNYRCLAAGSYSDPGGRGRGRDKGERSKSMRC